MSPDSRAGHHGDVTYVFEDAGFDSEPNDTEQKIFGSNAVLDTFDGSKEAVRVFNADRKAAEIIEQVFDGSWSVTCDLGEPPWWLAGIFGQPTATNISGSLYEYTYDLSNATDPTSLRLYLPTEGFGDYKVIPGAVIASVSIDQSQPNSPELSISGAYAREPFEDNTLSLSVPDFGESTFSNRHAEVTVAGSSVGKVQNANVSLEANTEMVNEVGSASAVDYTPKTFAPDVTHDKIISTTENTDLFNRFTSASQAAVALKYDNGGTGEDAYTVDWNIVDSFPDQWSESGRNDPEADLMNELQEMGEDANVVMQTDAGSSGNPPGITL